MSQIKPELYWKFENSLSHALNRVKAKVFNLIEASATNPQQATAMKGLVKGFLNDEYRLCVEDMRFEARNAGIIKPEEYGELLVPIGAEPLENVSTTEM